jgi:hypothetical protein
MERSIAMKSNRMEIRGTREYGKWYSAVVLEKLESRTRAEPHLITIAPDDTYETIKQAVGYIGIDADIAIVDIINA